MNHGLKVNGNILEITLPEEIHIDKVTVNREIFSQRQRVCESCKYHGLEGHEEPCVSCEVGNSNYVAVEERTEERTETHACDLIDRWKVRYKLAALVNELEEIFANIRERNVDNSICGLCEYDGAYIGQSGGLVQRMSRIRQG